MSTSSKKPVITTLISYNGYFSQTLSYLSLPLSESVAEWSSPAATTSRVSSTSTVPSDFSGSSHTLSPSQAASTKSNFRFETSILSSVGAGNGIHTRTPSMTRIIQRAEIRQVSLSAAAEAQTQPTLPAQKRNETLSRGPFPATPSPTGLPTRSPFSSPTVSSNTLPHASSQASSLESVHDSWDASCVIKSTVTGRGCGGASDDFAAAVTVAMGCWTDAASDEAASAVPELTSPALTPLTTSMPSATSTGMGGGAVAVAVTGSGSGRGSGLQHTSTAPAASTSSSVTPVVRYSDTTTMGWSLVALMGVMGVRDLLAM